MNSSNVFAISALVISLFSAWITFRAIKRGQALSAYDRSTDLFLEINHTLIAYPEIRPYFYEGKVSKPDDPNRDRVEAVAESLLDVFEWIWYRQSDLPAEDKQGWRDYILEMFEKSTVLSAYHVSQPQWHPHVEQLLNGRAK